MILCFQPRGWDKPPIEARRDGTDPAAVEFGGPCRKAFRDAFAAVRLPYANPHSYRKTLVRLDRRLCQTPEEWKAWSQNMGHDSEATTFVGYGEVASHRQKEIMTALANPRLTRLAGLDISALEAFLASARTADVS